MISRFLKRKIINFLLNNGKKSSAEFLVKKMYKQLLKYNKKNFKELLFLVLNFSLFSFQIDKKLFKTNKKQKFIKLKPIFIFSNNTRIFKTLKFIFKRLKTSKKGKYYKTLTSKITLITFNNNFFEHYRIQNQKDTILTKNILTYYRW